MNIEPQDTVAVDIDSLTGPALAWAVCLANGRRASITSGHTGAQISNYDEGHGSWSVVRLDDSEASEAMDKHWIGVERPSRGQKPPVWRALADYRGKRDPLRYVGVVCADSPDRRTAIFRCLVKSIFNDKVGVPKQLLLGIEVAA